MPLIISDETLAQLNLDEREARIEVACRFFGAEKLSIAQARALAGLDRIAFEDECKRRGIPVYRYTTADLEQDLAALESIERRRA